MKRSFFALAVLAALACTREAGAQFSEGFESGSGGWTFDAAVGGCSWGVDATPASSFGIWACSAGPYAGSGSGDPTVVFGASALNWNNGTSMDYGAATLPFNNSAISPVISVTSLVGLQLAFREFYENEGCKFAGALGTPSSHFRFVDILPAASLTPLATFNLAYDNSVASGGVPANGSVCGNGIADGTGNFSFYHQHTISLAGLPGGTTSFRLQFRFRAEAYIGVTDFPATGDTFEGKCCGWFVDQIAVTCPDVLPPSAPTLLLPADASSITSPALLDWTDATDTTSCGPGAILNYILEIDGDVAFTPAIFSTTTPTLSNAAVPLPPGAYFWRVRAVDLSGNVGPNSAVFSFTIQPPLPPLAPDTLFVNTSDNGAQSGDAGFVDHLEDQTPVFSAIYRDGNTNDNADGIRYQVSSDPTFATVEFDSGLSILSGFLPVGTRCPDVTINLELERDETYYWRCQFRDAGGATGPFSAAQSFQIGDDYDFGVRTGSHHGGRHCWVATAAWGSVEARPVQELQAWRFGTMEATGAGRVVSRAYNIAGAKLAPMAERSGAVRTVTGTLAAVAGPFGGVLAMCGVALLAMLGVTRFMRS